MGNTECCDERANNVREDLPAAGSEHTFRVQCSNSMKDYVAGDMTLDPYGKVGEREPLLRLHVSAILPQHDEEAEEVRAQRTIKAFKGKAEVARLTAEYRAPMPAAPAGRHHKDAHKATPRSTHVESVEFTLVLVGPEDGTLRPVEHDLDSRKASAFGTKESDYAQTYKIPDPGIEAVYKSEWGRPQVMVTTSDKADPLLCLSMAFAIAYWMHPSRVEKNAEKLELIPHKRQGR